MMKRKMIPCSVNDAICRKRTSFCWEIKASQKLSYFLYSDWLSTVKKLAMKANEIYSGKWKKDQRKKRIVLGDELKDLQKLTHFLHFDWLPSVEKTAKIKNDWY